MRILLSLIFILTFLAVNAQEDRRVKTQQFKEFNPADSKKLRSNQLQNIQPQKSNALNQKNLKFKSPEDLTKIIKSKAFKSALKKKLTLEDAVKQQYKSLSPAKLEKLSWIPDLSAYAYVKKTRDSQSIIGVYNGRDSVLLTLEQLNKSIVSNFGWEALKSIPHFKWVTSNTFYFKSNDHYLEYNLNGNLSKVVAYDAKSTNHDYLAKQNKLSYTKGNDLYIHDGQEEILVAESSADGVVYGQAVHRYEFGITKGTFWSPRGAHLAFYKKDESMVTDYPLLHLSTQPANAEMIKYPMAGGKSHEVEVGIYDLAEKTTIYIKFNQEEDFYKTNISWSADGKSVFVALINRGQDIVRLKSYDAATGKFKAVIWEEKSDKYIEPEHPLIHVKENNYLWLSEKNGHNQFYWIKNGKAGKQLLKADINVNKVLGISQDKRFILFEGQEADAINQYIYKTQLNSGKTQKVLSQEGWHTGLYNASKNMLLANYSSISKPKMVFNLDLNTKKIDTVLSAGDPLSKYNYARAEIVEIENNGVRLYSRIIKPSHFDSTKKYPALVYVYNGPHVQLVKNNWLAGASMWMYWMAEQGYIVYTIDGRGSYGRSIDFEQAVYRNLGLVEMEDQITGVNYLKSLPYINADRLAIHGWSFGGFMTTSLMLRHPDIFKVGVAGGPVIDWNMYEIMYTERYMDSPEENPEGYKSSSLFQYIPNLKGDLLMIHGVVDDVVLMQHSLEFVKQCVDKGVQMDYFVYPGHPHNVRGKDRVHLMQKVLDYIMDNL